MLRIATSRIISTFVGYPPDIRARGAAYQPRATDRSVTGTKSRGAA
jgi:hypothetical protein